jgi:hypothetical protein
MAEPITTGLISDSSARPLTPPTEPLLTSKTIVDIDDIIFNNLPRLSSRPYRILKLIEKVLGTSMVGRIEGGGGERRRALSLKKGKSNVVTIITLKRITSKPIRGDIEVVA